MSVGLSETVSVSQSVYVLVICVSVSPHGPPLPDLQSLSLSCLFLSSGGVHWHGQACGGDGLHPGGCQPVPHVPQRAVDTGPGG